MRSAFALRINSGKNIFIVVTLENLRIFQSYFFTGGGAKVMQLPLSVTGTTHKAPEGVSLGGFAML